VTFNKLHEMTKTSHFKGFESTRQSGQEFIMDKAIFLFYLAYLRRHEDLMLNSGKKEFSSLLDVIAGSSKVNEKELQDIDKETDFFESLEDQASEVASAGKTITSQIDLLLAMDAEPRRMTDLIKGSLDIKPSMMIGTLCQHTAWSYRLDSVFNRLVSQQVANYSKNAKKNNAEWV
jgi:hypothetical protein